MGRCDRVNYRPTAREGPPRLTKHIFCIIRVQGSSVAFVCADWGCVVAGPGGPAAMAAPGKQNRTNSNINKTNSHTKKAKTLDNIKGI